MSFALLYCFNAADASLSNQCVCGMNPRAIRYWCSFVYARSISLPFRFLRGSVRIALES
jgi:hypothetical protein